MQGEDLNLTLVLAPVKRLFQVSRQAPCILAMESPGIEPG